MIADSDPSVRGEPCHALGYVGHRGAGEKSIDTIVSALTNALGDEAGIAVLQKSSDPGRCNASGTNELTVSRAF